MKKLLGELATGALVALTVAVMVAAALAVLAACVWVIRWGFGL